MNARCQRVNLTSRWTRSHDIKCFLKDSIWHPSWGKWVQWYLTSETVFLFASCFLQPTPRNLGDQKKEEAISLLRQIPLWQLLPSFFSFPIKKCFYCPNACDICSQWKERTILWMPTEMKHSPWPWEVCGLDTCSPVPCFSFWGHISFLSPSLLAGGHFKI